ncbi:STAS domain-containing protein [Singulisphaera sp. GP187]|uniref:STAS domain-containing protein n=1 Tax=Singulisphaera sp. GP187 TaxID=1882752 RepID=UPI000926C910|nr:STAS domain-containing protein [Singulisphaera sp. GP187]SIO40759.1 STAS domain-containing protein [Singulisphaera sp. GP187]
MSSGFGPDDTLIDMFRAEVEAHSEVLSTALLALERAPGDTSRLDEMMRAAHSIKGAARVVDVDPAARVAHVMEDCFVEAQKGTLSFSPGDIDVLLRGVDLLGKISNATRDPNADLELAFSGPVQAQVVELRAVLSGTGPSGRGAVAVESAAPAPSPLAVAPQSEPATASPPPPSVTTIAFPDILDSAAVERIRGQFLAAIDSPCATIQFDLRATRDLDVQGLAFLAAVPRHLARLGRSSLELAGVSVEMATVFRVTGLDQPFGLRRGPMREAE